MRVHSSASSVLLLQDVATLASTARQLRRRGHVVIGAGTCLEASAVKRVVDVIVADVCLPDGDGIELSRRWTDSGRARCAVFFTTLTSAKVRARAEAVGPLVDRSLGVACLARVLEPGRSSNQR